MKIRKNALKISEENAVRGFLEKIGGKLGFQKKEDWYNMKWKDISKSSPKLKTLLSRFEASPPKLMNFIYPSHEWLEWKFESVPKGFWSIHMNQRKWLDWLGEQLGYKSLEDWYQITTKIIHDKGGITLLEKYGGSPSNMVISVYNEHEWMIWRVMLIP